MYTNNESIASVNEDINEFISKSVLEPFNNYKDICSQSAKGDWFFLLMHIFTKFSSINCQMKQFWDGKASLIDAVLYPVFSSPDGSQSFLRLVLTVLKTHEDNFKTLYAFVEMFTENKEEEKGLLLFILLVFTLLFFFLVFETAVGVDMMVEILLPSNLQNISATIFQLLGCLLLIISNKIIDCL
ncbi:hypothetical protein EDC94DRAFT_583507 [Helicostylum pulchrum]|nr:hypothetical protein EDC94DRAFT_583507 [Helicostylum pulchrum]